MIRLARAAYCPDCDMLFELTNAATPCCGQRTWVPLARWLGDRRDAAPSATSQYTRFGFLTRYAPRNAEGFRRFFVDLAALLHAERVMERRRLVTDNDLYAEAVEQTAREIAQQKAREHVE